MTIFTPIFNYGDHVAVYDRRGTEKGKIEFWGKIVARIRMSPMHYDVTPDGETRREPSIPEYRIKHE